MSEFSGTVLKIYTLGETVLRQKTTEISDYNDDIRRLANDMIVTMYAANGIGLAAPQVGKSISLCVIDVSPCIDTTEVCRLDGNEVKVVNVSPIVLINPKITRISDRKSVCEEGCLSIPGCHEKVERPSDVCLDYFNLDGKLHTLECRGLLATCSQHEIDHLDGILFIDKAIISPAHD
jgi:peptide deformylase